MPVRDIGINAMTLVCVPVTGITLRSADIDRTHATLQADGVDVDAEINRWGGGVPDMFWVRDPDGHSLIIVQPEE